MTPSLVKDLLRLLIRGLLYLMVLWTLGWLLTTPTAAETAQQLVEHPGGTLRLGLFLLLAVSLGRTLLQWSPTADASVPREVTPTLGKATLGKATPGAGGSGLGEGFERLDTPDGSIRLAPKGYREWVEATGPKSEAQRREYALANVEKYQTRLRATPAQCAAHEAAHAVVAHAVGAHIHHVRTNGVEGATNVETLAPVEKFDIALGMRRDICIRAAGLLHDLQNECNEWGGLQDLVEVQHQELGLQFLDPTVDIEATRAALVGHARALLAQHDGAVEALAAKLREGGWETCLDGETVVQLLEAHGVRPDPAALPETVHRHP